MLIGADASGRKELLAIEDGFRESAQSWRELLLRLRDENGLVLAPELATSDGALGFWRALHQVWPSTRQQRCWVHKTANVLNTLPKSLHGPGSCAAVLAEGSRERDGQAGSARDLPGPESQGG
jgi:putative transposase